VPVVRSRYAFCMKHAIIALALSALACGGPAEPAKTPEAAPVNVTPQIVTNKTDGTAAELRARADAALLKQDYREAILALEALRVAEPSARVYLDLAGAYEALPDTAKAQETYRALRETYGKTEEGRIGLRRHANLVAYLEAWAELKTLGDALLLETPLDDVTKMAGLGARGLAAIEAGDDTAAMRDVQNGLDLVDSLHYGASGRLPVAAAQLRFGLAEVRRVRSERITFANVPTESFMTFFEMRCALLMDAQSAYTDAIRSEDPRWAAMSGYRVGVMYERLHKDLMAIPPTKQANTKDKQALFYSMMHVRYRVLLEKGHDMMIRTIELGEKLNDASSWLEKSRTTKISIEKAIEEEKATIAKLPYTEEEVQKALDILKKKVLEKQEKEANAKKR
jgi:tetratricopeptide (TPR) repeat protein